MKTKLWKIAGVLLFPIIIVAVLFALPPAPRAFADSPGVKSVVDANTAFAVDLYQQLRTQPENLFFSPYSISTALAMTWAGARGQTETDMAKALHFDSA